jgi:hypothetical protein
VRNVVRRRAGEPQFVAAVTASDLLARPDPDGHQPAGDGDFPIPVGMLADLHDPRLIITSEYVGPDRRALDRHERREQRREERRRRDWHPGSEFLGARLGGAPSTRTRHLAAAVVLTALTVAPLTLVASHLSGPAAPARSTRETHTAVHRSTGTSTPLRPPVPVPSVAH